MSKILVILSFLFLTFSSCQFFEEEEEKKFHEDLLFSDVDGQEYLEAFDQGGARAVSSLVLLGYIDQVEPEMLSMVADSMPIEDSLWRNRHYEAISAYNEIYDDIPSSINYKFGIAIFHMLMYHPKEVIRHFDSATALELDFWNERLKEEIQYKSKSDSVPIANMIAMSQDHCNQCDTIQIDVIRKMIVTLNQDL
ncbi:MAG: hypothetical protein H6599_10650 [Flavobacteriales bacterium]|nr:hypothetical protein [Flavobacteriales bacterium]